MYRFVYFLALLFLLLACEQKELTAEEIIDKTIENAGGEAYENAEINFDFRDISYKSTRENGKFQLERVITDTSGTTYNDILSNEGFKRYHKDTIVPLKDSMKIVYGNSVNSVHYFVQLPYGLNDAAVRKNLLRKDSIAGKEYYEIEVTFAAGGGAAHKDIYLYWIHTEDFTIDYLSYIFEEEGGGVRFRKAYNPRRVGGIRFVDYENYKTDDLSIPLHELDEKFEAGELELLSKIENRNIEVSIRK